MKRQSESFLADSWLLKRRLREVGLSATREVQLHENLRVMVSITGSGVLRLHRGYVYATDEVLKAIVVFVTPGTKRREASRARATLLSFPVSKFFDSRPVRKVRPTKPRPEDVEDIRRLGRLHAELNQLHFDSRLSDVPLRISRRMRRKLGEITLDENDRPTVITIGRLHLDRDGWKQVSITLLHEMVHQWQAETGRAVDHGKVFRKKATEVGIPAAASRRVLRKRKTA